MGTRGGNNMLCLILGLVEGKESLVFLYIYLLNLYPLVPFGLSYK